MVSEMFGKWCSRMLTLFGYRNLFELWRIWRKEELCIWRDHDKEMFLLWGEGRMLKV